MRAFRYYIDIAWYNIRHNKAYAIFCSLGTAITFIFIIMVLQLTYTIVGNDPPLRNADRTIRMEFFYGDTGPDHAWDKKYFFLEGDVTNLHNLIKDYEACGISHSESVNPLINGQLKTVVVNFVNPDYWIIKDFDFIEGRAFEEHDYQSTKPVAVIKESNAILYFGNTREALDKEIEFQGNTYHIIGVVKDFSLLAGNEWSGIWVPHKYNKGVPSGWMNYIVEYMFPIDMSPEIMKENVWRGVRHHFEQQDKEIIEPIELSTVREEIVKSLGGEMFKYGVIGVILILLILPALNIISLNMANADNRSEEIAICRAMGSTKGQAFMRIMTETMLLIFIGALIGLILTFPVLHLVDEKLLALGVSEGAKLITQINIWVFIFGIIPIALIFAFLSGGIPAYKISHRNISAMLKGNDSENLQILPKRMNLTWIFIEQVLVFIAIMICIVSIYKLADIVRSPGMLDTDNTLVYGYAASAQNESFNWRDVGSTMFLMPTINEELKKKEYVVDISKSHNFIPYGGTADGMELNIKADGSKIKVDLMAADPEAMEVFKPLLDEGEWFYNKEHSQPIPCIITRQLADSLHWNEAVGHTLTIQISNDYLLESEVIGVLEGIKKDLFKESQIGIIIPSEVISTFSMTASGYFAVRLDNDLNKDDFTNEFYNLFVRRKATETAIEPVILDLNRYKSEQFVKGAGNLIAQSVPTFFFLIFGFLGTFGLIWLNTEKRKTEFALRRAVGSTQIKLKLLIISENLLLTCTAMIPGLLLTFFIYSFTKIEILGIITAFVLMLLFSFLSSCYPAHRGSQYPPAEALHYE